VSICRRGTRASVFRVTSSDPRRKLPNRRRRHVSSVSVLLVLGAEVSTPAQAGHAATTRRRDHLPCGGLVGMEITTTTGAPLRRPVRLTTNRVFDPTARSCSAPRAGARPPSWDGAREPPARDSPSIRACDDNCNHFVKTRMVAQRRVGCSLEHTASGAIPLPPPSRALRRPSGGRARAVRGVTRRASRNIRLGAPEGGRGAVRRVLRPLPRGS
jgi:hypothetical protein